MEDIKVTVKQDTVRAEPSGASVDVFPVPLQGYLNIDRPTTEEAQQLKEIWDFIDGEGEADKLYRIQQLENRLGSPALGQTRLDKLYEYAKITRQIDTLEKMRDGLQGNSTDRR